MKALVSELYFRVQPCNQIDCILRYLGLRKEKLSFYRKKGSPEAFTDLGSKMCCQLVRLLGMKVIRGPR